MKNPQSEGPTMDRECKIGAYVDGELDRSERELVEAWLDSDPTLRTLARELGEVDRLARTSTPPAVTGDEWARSLDRVLEAAHDPQVTPIAAVSDARAASRGAPRWWVPLAAAAVLALAGWIALQHGSEDAASPGADGVAAPAVSADDDAPRTAVVPGDEGELPPLADDEDDDETSGSDPADF